MDDIRGFISEAWDDIKSPTTSDFTSKLPQLKDLVGNFEQVIDVDRSGVTKLRKAIKAMLNSGNAHIENEKVFAESLEKLGNFSMLHEDDVPEIAEAFVKFAVVAKEMSALMKTLISNLRSSVMIPLEMFTKDPRDTHADCRKAYEKAHKELENKFHKVGKERLRLAESAGLHRKAVTGPEVAEDTDKERKLLQLQACEYLLKVNEARSRKGVDLLNHLVEYYQSQTSFFKDGMQTINHFNSYVTSMIPKLTNLKDRQDTERRQLVELKESLKNLLATYKEDGNQSALTKAAPLLPFIQSKEVGSEFVGYLLKKSESMIKKIWQKRKCSIKDGVMSISHSDENKPPVRLNLLTCQAKVISDDPGKKCFDLLSSSNNRTYHFQAEDEQDLVRWISVLNNAKEAQLLLAFSDNKGSQGNANLRELQKQLIAEIRKLPGNDHCCDCGAADPEWLSVNFGVIICLECCGVHRELGVHISRTQSLVIDELGTSQLLIASVMSNGGFNEIMEATLTSVAKDSMIKPDSPREQRTMYIRSKYEGRRYAIKTCADTDELKQELFEAVSSSDIYALLQVFAERVDLLTPLPTENTIIPTATKRKAIYDTGNTALHKAIMEENGRSLYIIDFLVQNSDSKKLDMKDMQGNTALHVAAEYNQGEAMKLILRANTNLASVKNNQSKTPLDVAKENNYDLCIELLQHALDGRTSLFENVNIDWLLIQDDYVDFSDDDLESHTPEKQRSRPTSMVSEMLAERRKTASDSTDTASLLSVTHRGERRKTGEIITDVEDKLKEKKTPVDRMRRKTTDNVLSQSQLSSSGTNKGSVKVRATPGGHPGHSRAVSDHTVGTYSNGSDTTDAVFRECTFRSFTSTKTSAANSSSVTSVAKHPTTLSISKVNTTSGTATSNTKSAPTAKAAPATTAAPATKAAPAAKAAPATKVAMTSTAPTTIESEQKAATGKNVTAASGTKTVTSSSVSSPRLSVKDVNSTLVSSGNRGVTPPPLPEKRVKVALGAVNVSPAAAPNPPTVPETTKSSKEVLPTLKPLTNISNKPATKPEPTPRKGSVPAVSVSSPKPSTAAGSNSKPAIRPKPQLGPSVSLPIRRRCRALYDCKADNGDELSFFKDEVIVILKSPPDSNWWEGEIDGNPKRKGLFPTTHVAVVNDV